MMLQAESVSQNIASEWDAVSGWHHLRKRRPILIMQNEKRAGVAHRREAFQL